ncbi:DUF6009 family protein [Streptomyces venetus]|uniref:DUF6009 family protein n=1 Tax=Streptomyces venetus TaxID=1701086 RepID=UPI0031E57D92
MGSGWSSAWTGRHGAAQWSDPAGLYANTAPAEAIDPRTLEPRIKGSKTERWCRQ